MCISLAQKAKALGPITDRLAEEKRRELWSNARAALHFSAVASARDHSRGGWYPTYGGHCDRLAIDDFVWAIDFLDYHYEAQDEIAVADTFFMLSQARPIALWARSPKFVGAIIFAMQPDRSTQVRHAALHTAWEIRIALGSPDDAMGPLLPKFAEALLSAVLTDIHPANQTETDYSPDRFTYYERDLRYLHILYTFAQNENGTWDELLRSKGHLQRCLDMVQHGSAPTLFLYLVAMVWSCESHDAEHHFLDDFNPKMRACQFADAWDHLTFVSHTGGWQTVIEEELEETLPALIALTRRYSGINNEPLVPVRNIQPVLEQLRECRPHSPMVPEIEDLVKWLKACDNSGSEVH
ncbi:hypothetical protein BV22DRAFT_566463 [Leucogyrophana mollusca]|uniref:Uncharacterized protein n=1 Tax=Leucogyrophana mollusca TaxID=85980 RepID=A0ACB8BFV2_9AGAM|nr:hypothetical protein BV22DRAFT_566463 [Leucogyrophana mollusca]